MNRRRLIIGAITLGGALLTLAFLQGGYESNFARLLFDAVIMGAALTLFSRIQPARTAVGEGWRLILGALFSAVSFVGVALLILTFGGEGSTSDPIGWNLAGRILLTLAESWTVLALIRLGGTAWHRRRRTLTVFGVIALFLVLGDAPDPALAMFAILFVLIAMPWHWLERISNQSGWMLLVLFLFAPVGFLLHNNGLSVDPGASVTAGLQVSSSSSSFLTDSQLLNLAYTTISWVWFILPLRVILALFQGMFGIRIPIWLKFGTTYLFSTLIPGTLLLLLGLLAVYIGIGSMRGGNVRDLVQQDLQDLAQLLEEDRLHPASSPPDLAWATYQRVTPTRPAPDKLPPAPNPLRSGQTGLEPDPSGWDGSATLPESWRMYARLDSLLGQRGELELWVRQDQAGSWQMPDTLAPFPGWRYGTTSRRGILPVDSSQVVFAAARTVPGDPTRVRVAMRPFDEETLEGYKQIVRADITVHPLAVVQVGDSDFEYSFAGDLESHGYHGELSTTRADGEAFLEKPILHGVTELQNWRDPSHPSTTTYIGRVQVYTSLHGLWYSLYAWEGLNRITIAIIFVLIGLFGLALVFSTLLAGGITRTIMRSLKELRQGTERLRQGDLEVQLHPRSNDELGDLAISFNQMTSDLRRMISEVTVKERLEREVQIARRIQVHLLPTELPQRANLQVGARSDPAFEVGGDYYDCIDLGDRGLLVALGDVSGKGVGAAVLMSNLQASLSLLATQDIPLEDMVRLLNAQVYKNSTPEMFITFFAGLFNPEKGVMTYVNAGHDVPFLLRYGKPIDLEAGGMLLGIMEDTVYEPGEIDLQPGDMFTAYSDGLTEAMDEADEEFGRDRLIEVLNDNKHLDASRLVNKVLEAIRDYAGHERAGRDDLTLLTVRVLED